jgi:hypothetical protein
MAYLSLGLDHNEPVDTFVQAQGPTPGSSIRQVSQNFDPQATWRLDVTLRGVSTFITSLQIFVREIVKGIIPIESILDTLLRVTRFPPVLCAIARLRDAGGVTPNSSMANLNLLMDVFSAISSSIATNHRCASVLPRPNTARSW